jgi:hypothetical protein
MKDFEQMKNERLNYIFTILKNSGCDNISINYSGGGDDGQMELGDYVPNNNKIRICLDEPTIFNSMYHESEELDFFNLLEEISEYFLNVLGVDWVNGMGSSGQVFFDVEKRNVTVGYQVMEEKEAVFA